MPPCRASPTSRQPSASSIGCAPCSRRRAADAEVPPVASSWASIEDWYHPSWIPFAGNGYGDFLCIDLAPAAGGVVGQVVRLLHDDPVRQCQASSLAALLAALAGMLSAGWLACAVDERSLVTGPI